MAYVAATRARDLLVVPVVGDVEWDVGWTSPLNAAVYPPMDARRSPSMAGYHPAFKKDSVFKRPDDDPFTSATVQPGVHEFGDGAERYCVVWWDPHALSLGAEASLGLRRESLIMKDVEASVVDEGLREYQRWQSGRAEAIASGATASLLVRTATEWAADADADVSPLVSPATSPAIVSAPVQFGLFEEPPVPVAREAARPLDVAILDLRDATRLGGARFGELVHAMLASAPLGGDRASYAAAADVHARILGAPEEERAAAVDAVMRVSSHAVLQRAAAADDAGRARRECPVTFTAPDGTLLEGVVDLAFEDGGEWAVVDFKTDREISQAGIDRYRRQVALYAAAISKATGSPARAFLVRL